jgi:hypothetical protein
MPVQPVLKEILVPREILGWLDHKVPQGYRVKQDHKGTLDPQGYRGNKGQLDHRVKQDHKGTLDHGVKQVKRGILGPMEFAAVPVILVILVLLGLKVLKVLPVQMGQVVQMVPMVSTLRILVDGYMFHLILEIIAHSLMSMRTIFILMYMIVSVLM